MSFCFLFCVEKVLTEETVPVWPLVDPVVKIPLVNNARMVHIKYILKFLHPSTLSVCTPHVQLPHPKT